MTEAEYKNREVDETEMSQTGSKDRSLLRDL